ncbi:MAG: MoaD/ThiS family protein [Candidatus Geothermarchaeales archaeon]
MGKVMVDLRARLRTALGKKQVELTLEPGSNVKSLLELLSKEYPVLEPLLKGEMGKYGHLIIMVNNKKESLERRVNDGDVVSILETVAGGMIK